MAAKQTRDDKPKTFTVTARHHRQMLRNYRQRAAWARKSEWGDIEDDANEIIEALEGAIDATIIDVLSAADGIEILACLRASIVPSPRRDKLVSLFEEAYER